MVIFIIKYLFLFITGALMGWGIEVIFRRYFGGAKRWINPGFLSGPYLPLYGSATCILYIISDSGINFYFKMILFMIVTTVIEYVTGMFFLKYYNTRLWDYTKLKGNVRGIIAPLYSVFWTVLSLVFYFVLYPYFYKRIEFLYEHLEFSLLVGIVCGMIMIDTINSFDILSRLKKITDIIEESKEAILYEQLKIEIREKLVNIKERRGPLFLLPFRGDYNLMEYVKEHYVKLKDEGLDRARRIRRRG